MEVIKIDKRKALIPLTIVVAAAILGGIILNAYSTAYAQTGVNNGQSWNFGNGWFNGNMNMEMRGMHNHGMRGRCCFGYGSIEVSEEFKQNVINVAQNDADVQNLLSEGYNITAVKPIIKTVVEGDGTVVTKATSAILILEKNTSGRAFVWVDLEQQKVTRIEILTITVIEKP
ncbi:MAG: hypothetical protein QW667_07915 [Candidatus Bathyarchaeia archaeon]